MSSGLPALKPEIQRALVAAIARLSSTPPHETVDRFLERVMIQGVSLDVRKLCGNVTPRLMTFTMGNDAAAQADDQAIIALLQHGTVVDKFNAITPVLQQRYLLEHGELKALLIIRPR